MAFIYKNISLILALDRGGWSTPRPGRVTPRSDLMILSVLEVGWAPRPVRTGCGKSSAVSGQHLVKWNCLHVAVASRQRNVRLNVTARHILLFFHPSVTRPCVCSSLCTLVMQLRHSLLHSNTKLQREWSVALKLRTFRCSALHGVNVQFYTHISFFCEVNVRAVRTSRSPCL